MLLHKLCLKHENEKVGGEIKMLTRACGRLVRRGRVLQVLGSQAGLTGGQPGSQGRQALQEGQQLSALLHSEIT